MALPPGDLRLPGSSTAPHGSKQFLLAEDIELLYSAATLGATPPFTEHLNEIAAQFLMHFPHSEHTHRQMQSRLIALIDCPHHGYSVQLLSAEDARTPKNRRLPWSSVEHYVQMRFKLITYLRLVRNRDASSSPHRADRSADSLPPISDVIVLESDSEEDQGAASNGARKTRSNARSKKSRCKSASKNRKKRLRNEEDPSYNNALEITRSNLKQPVDRHHVRPSPIPHSTAPRPNTRFQKRHARRTPVIDVVVIESDDEARQPHSKESPTAQKDRPVVSAHPLATETYDHYKHEDESASILDTFLTNPDSLSTTANIALPESSILNELIQSPPSAPPLLSAPFGPSATPARVGSAASRPRTPTTPRTPPSLLPAPKHPQNANQAADNEPSGLRQNGADGDSVENETGSTNVPDCGLVKNSRDRTNDIKNSLIANINNAKSPRPTVSPVLMPKSMALSDERIDESRLQSLLDDLD